MFYPQNPAEREFYAQARSEALKHYRRECIYGMLFFTFFSILILQAVFAASEMIQCGGC